MKQCSVVASKSLPYSDKVQIQVAQTHYAIIFSFIIYSNKTTLKGSC